MKKVKRVPFNLDLAKKGCKIFSAYYDKYVTYNSFSNGVHYFNVEVVGGVITFGATNNFGLAMMAKARNLSYIYCEVEEAVTKKVKLPFDLEKAKAGAKLVYASDGEMYDTKELKFLRVFPNGDLECIRYYKNENERCTCIRRTPDGKYGGNNNHGLDLMIEEEVEVLEVTMEEVAAKFGVGVDEIQIKK